MKDEPRKAIKNMSRIRALTEYAKFRSGDFDFRLDPIVQLIQAIIAQNPSQTIRERENNFG